MIILQSIHVAANDIISFFLWLSNTPLYIYIYVTDANTEVQARLSASSKFQNQNRDLDPGSLTSDGAP